MFKVGDKVRVVRVDKEDRHTNLKIGDVGIVSVIQDSSVFVDFGGTVTINGKPVSEFYVMRIKQLEKVEDGIMTRGDLKDGMICITRCGNKYMWLYGELRRIETWCLNTKENLKNKNLDKFDIMKIYEPIGETIEEMLDHDYSTETPIWERIEPKKMTVAEIEAALGYPVEVVK